MEGAVGTHLVWLTALLEPCPRLEVLYAHTSTRAGTWGCSPHPCLPTHPSLHRHLLSPWGDRVGQRGVGWRQRFGILFVWSSGTAELHIKWKCLCKTENPAVLLLGLSVPGPPSDSLGPLLPELPLLQFPSSSSSPLKAYPPQCLREDKPPSAPPLPSWGSPL